MSIYLKTSIVKEVRKEETSYPMHTHSTDVTPLVQKCKNVGTDSRISHSAGRIARIGSYCYVGGECSRDLT